MSRVVWMTAGGIALALGAIGIFLPLLPTVPFLLLAAFCFARGSKSAHAWLLSHPIFGPPIRDWQERGAVRRSAKYLASLSILASFLIVWLIGIPSRYLLVQFAVLAGVAVFIWTRPES